MSRHPLLPRHRRRRDASDVAAAEDILRRMDPVRRDALLLHRIHGLTYAETGARLSLTRAEVIDAITSAVAALADEPEKSHDGRTKVGVSSRWCQANANQSPLFADEQVPGDKKVAPFAKRGVT